MAGEWEGWEKGWEQAVEESMKHRDPAFEELIKAIHIEAFNEKQKMAQIISKNIALNTPKPFHYYHPLLSRLPF